MTSMNGFYVIFLIIGAALIVSSDLVAAKVDLSCGKSLTHKCGQAIGKRVKWEKGSAALTDKCCIELVKIGKPCHDEFTKAYKESKHFRGRTYSLLKRSDLVWNHCEDVVKFLIPGGAQAPIAN